MLKKIAVCQGMQCQNKGAKGLLHRLTTVYKGEFHVTRSDLNIVACECLGDCEQGPVIQVNDTVFVREMDNKKATQLLQNPAAILGDIQHVAEEDRATFANICEGELF